MNDTILTLVYFRWVSKNQDIWVRSLKDVKSVSAHKGLFLAVYGACYATFLKKK